MYGVFLGWLQDSALGATARSAGWTYAAVNTLHVLGAALVLGAIAVFDLLVLTGRRATAAESARVAVPLAAAGLLLQAATGLFLLSADARASGVNPAFQAKLAFMAVGLVNIAILYGWAARAAGPVALHPAAPAFAAVSLVAWTATILAGRLIAYV